jgi:hypothetical protein
VIHLSHPDRPDLAIDPGTKAPSRLRARWLKPIYPADRRPPAALVRCSRHGHERRALRLGRDPERGLPPRAFAEDRPDLDPRRFRGNLWLDGLAPWEEFDLVGKRLRIGAAELDVVEPIGRCRATEANPDTGRRDANDARRARRRLGPHAVRRLCHGAQGRACRRWRQARLGMTALPFPLAEAPDDADDRSRAAYSSRAGRTS